MEMGARGFASHPNLSYFISSFHPLSGLYKNLVEVAVAGGHTKSMEDQDNLSDGVIISNVRNDSIGRGNHRRPYPILDI